MDAQSRNAPFQCSTLVDLLQWRAFEQATQRGYTMLLNGELEESSITYKELDQLARSIGAHLQGAGLTGQRILLIYPPGLQYIAAFFGCLYAGCVAVPVYPPRLNRSVERLQRIAFDCQAATALTTTTISADLKRHARLHNQFGALSWVATDNIDATLAESWQRPDITHASLAFLQYTSGSTAAPKGVMLSHDNLLQNLSAMHSGFGLSMESKGVIWLPPYHDMGLIGGILQPLFGAFPVILMSPATFLQRPVRWLQAISRSHGTISGGPNFAYELCIRKITSEQQIGLDLSSWTHAFTGAEPVRAETLQQFASTFAACGFEQKAFYPCYGLAESTLFVTGRFFDDGSATRSLKRSALASNQVVLLEDDVEDGYPIVSCGKAPVEQQLVIVDPATEVECLPGSIGEIWLASPSVAQGYWNQPEQTLQAFSAQLAGRTGTVFLRTGDMGFTLDAELFVTGRLKDLIIIRGRNHYPQDIELTVEQCHPALQKGCCAAFSCEVAGAEQLVIVQEVRREYRHPDVEGITRAIRQAVAEEHELQVYAVLLLSAGRIPKTSSGKIQRHICRSDFLHGRLQTIGQSIFSTKELSTEPVLLGATITRESLLEMSLPDQQSLLAAYLQQYLAQIVGTEPSQIDVQMPLATYGLDSLLGLQLQTEIETRLGIEYSLSMLFSHATLSQIVSDLLSLMALEPSTLQLQAVVHDTKKPSPLSYGQRALWFTQHLSPESGILNVSRAARVQGSLNLDALQAAFQSMIDRHASLRTTFTTSGDQPYQYIEAKEVLLRVEDATDWKQDRVFARLEELAYRPIDLANDPLLQLYVFTRASQEHILLFVAHHIAVDFWSLSLLLHEFIQVYSAHKRHIEITLTKIPLQYIEYVYRQNEMLAGPIGEHLWEYWEKQLSGALPVLQLPLDTVRPSTIIAEGAARNFQLGIELTRKIKLLAQAEEVTTYTLLLSVLQVLLYRYTEQEDIIIGSPTSGRSASDVMNIVGYFVNPVSIRVDLSGEPTYQHFLKHVRESVIAAFEHQNYPFALLMERLRPARDTHTPHFFTVVFNWLKTHTQATRNLEAFALDEPNVHLPFDSELLETLPLKRQMTQFELELTMAEVDQAFHGQLKYNATLFSSAYIERMLGHFTTLLESVVADPRQKIALLPLLTQAEWNQLSTERNDLNDYVPDRCIHQMFEVQVIHNSSALAISSSHGELSYAELNRLSNQLAHGLLALDLHRGQPVALLVESSPQHICALLAVLKAGGIFMCLDTRSPAGRLQQILAEVRPALLICDAASLNVHQELLQENTDDTFRFVMLDVPTAQLVEKKRCVSIEHFNALPQTNPAIAVRPTDPAYIAYTSGSTGKPKGIVHTHQSFAQFIVWQSKQFSITTPQRVAQMASPTFDVSYCEIFGTLCFGATLCLIPAAIRHDPRAFVSWMQQEKISLLQVVASFFAQMLRSIENEHGRYAFPQLRFVLFVGEALPVAMMQRALVIFPRSLQFFNLYGPTEAVAATYYRVEDVDIKRTIPIGRAMDGRQILILDRYMQLCPIGIKGEIYIRSPFIALGYFKQEAATQKVFIQNPLHDAYPDRVYRTGDLGRWLPDGNIEYAGRIDNQVKVRGIRIELEEIEIALLRHKLVRECAVTVHHYNATDQRLIAYIVANETLSKQEIRLFSHSILPIHMAPSIFVFLAALPRNPNGKLDRKILPVPDLQTRDSEEEYRPPQTLLELLITRVWCELLHVDDVGMNDSFFALGGHSLLAMQVVNRVRLLTSIELPLQTLLEQPTVAHISAEIARRGGEKLFERINRVAARVEGLSDADVRSLLQQKVLQKT